jgi:hypothetical protein
MGVSRVLCYCAVVTVALLGGCATKQPGDELGAADSNVLSSLEEFSAPLDLREFDVAEADGGYRGVFLKLSRLPTGVVSTAQSDPARIVLDIQGPTGAESPEEVFPAGDTVVTHVAVSRHVGWLRVVLDLQGDETPEFGVYPMADWVVVRIKPLNPRTRPWAHRES